ncbi:MAG: peptidase C2 calpain [Goleter apudmare HA4340-LM2]|jgi:hypothetical protein|nr:peptidase C2 calpain [Goleter apudmare HA4340-LM2]
MNSNFTEHPLNFNDERPILPDIIGLAEINSSSISRYSSSYIDFRDNHRNSDISDIKDLEFDSHKLSGFESLNSDKDSNTSDDGFGVETTKLFSTANSTVDEFGIPIAAQKSNHHGYENSLDKVWLNNWLSTNLLDQQLITKTQDLVADGQLSRTDMIAIFRNAQDDDVIDGNEYKDLQTILNNASYFRLEDHVSALSSKVVFGTTANAYYQGQTLGNLYAGSSSTQMETLISKWFLGVDRPSTAYNYELAAGSLFKDGVSYADISQGLVGNCYFLAALAKVAISSPKTIESMFIDNGDNTFTVRFYNNGVADYVTVDMYLPIDSVNEFIYANQAGAAWGKYYDKNNELWVALAEKAYAQINESGWIAQDGTNSYAGITGGWETDAIAHITGVTARSSQEFDWNAMVNAYQAGTLIGIASKAVGLTDSRIVPNHVYVVVDYNPVAQQFTLFNPWGVDGGWSNGEVLPGFLKVSINDLKLNFAQWSYKV